MVFVIDHGSANSFNIHTVGLVAVSLCIAHRAFRVRLWVSVLPRVCVCLHVRVCVCVSTCVQLLFGTMKKNLHIAFYVCHAFAFRTVWIALEDKTNCCWVTKLLREREKRSIKIYTKNSYLDWEFFWFWFSSAAPVLPNAGQ